MDGEETGDDPHVARARFGVSITLDAPAEPGSGPVEVGWLLTETRGAVLYDAPVRVRSPADKPVHPKSVAACPAVLGLESRLFAVPCPFDLALEFAADDFGNPGVRSAAGERSALREGLLDHLIIMSPREEWRRADRPVLQLRLPYVFVADEPVHMAQLPPFLHMPRTALPGLTIGGRFPIHVWPRPLSWAFEWHDTGAPLVLHRGEPLFYLNFETLPQGRPVQLVAAERTPELAEYMDAIAGVVNYVDKTFSLFEAAEACRPARLVRRER
mgnify:CR=1 FL=1